MAKGEVHALVGENGAGKSTMIKTITGAITPDEGKVIYEGKEYTELNPILSSQIGIEAIYQEFNLAPELTVQENIYMGTKVNQSIFIDRKELAERTKKILKELNTNIDPNVRIKDLTVAYMQLDVYKRQVLLSRLTNYLGESCVKVIEKPIESVH